MNQWLIWQLKEIRVKIYSDTYMFGTILRWDNINIHQFDSLIGGVVKILIFAFIFWEGMLFVWVYLYGTAVNSKF